MKALEKFLQKGIQIPTETVWILNLLFEYKGKQELYSKQSPEKLKSLKESSIIESAVSSNRIEGVYIDLKRIGTVVFGKSDLTDRNEEEVRGYQEALAHIHNNWNEIEVNTEIILKLHKMTKPNIWDSGKLKEKDGEIIEKFPDGRISVRFKPVFAKETPNQLKLLCDYYKILSNQKKIPSLILIPAFNLDFLSIHPFRDGNGRVSRLLLLLLLYKAGFEVGQYISLERIIEKSKERYYEALKLSSDKWHSGEHSYWEYVNYILFTFYDLYKEFENRFQLEFLESSEKGSEKSSEKIINCLKLNPKTTISELSKKLQLSTRAVEKQIKKLKEANKLVREGSKKGGYWKVK